MRGYGYFDEWGDIVNCNYCTAITKEKLVVSGKYTGCTFWECPECTHAWMDDQQEEQRKRVDMGLDIQKEKQ
jgi:hypothetical protein